MDYMDLPSKHLVVDYKRYKGTGRPRKADYVLKTRGTIRRETVVIRAKVAPKRGYSVIKNIVGITFVLICVAVLIYRYTNL